MDSTVNPVLPLVSNSISTEIISPGSKVILLAFAVTQSQVTRIEFNSTVFVDSFLTLKDSFKIE